MESCARVFATPDRFPPARNKNKNKFITKYFVPVSPKPEARLSASLPFSEIRGALPRKCFRRCNEVAECRPYVIKSCNYLY